MARDPLDIEWAEVVDILASEYGWTIKYIRSLDLGQIISLLKAIKLRYKKQEKAVKEGMATLREDGMEKIKQGVTTVDELMRETTAF